MIDEISDGKLKSRIDLNNITGSYKETSSKINVMLDLITQPLNVAADYVNKISKGDIPPKIVDEYKGDFNEIKINLNQCIDAVNLLVSDAGSLVKAAVEGKL